MCCSTGICGTNLDPDLVNFAAMLSQLSSHGIKIERYNLAQQPMAFVLHEQVKALLEKEGERALPVIFLNGEVRYQGRYPTREERPQFIRDALGESEKAS